MEPSLFRSASSVVELVSGAVVDSSGSLPGVSAAALVAPGPEALPPGRASLPLARGPELAGMKATR